MADNEVTPSRKKPTLRGPTKDYREFKGKYRNRSYSIYRIIITNFREMISSKWAIAILILSYLFLSFNLLGLVFSAAFEEEDIMERYEFFQPDMHYRIEHVNGRSLNFVDTGDQVTITYRVTNIGEDTGQFSTMAFKPNPHWSVFVDVKGSTDLSPGESSLIDLIVDIPDTPENFSEYSADDPFLSLGMGYRDGIVVDNGPYGYDEKRDSDDRESYPDIGNVYYEEGDMVPANIVYSFNRTRAVSLLVAPTEVLEKMSMEGISGFDVRIGSISTLFSLNEDGAGSGGILMYFVDEDPVDVKMEAPSRKEKKLLIKNEGNREVILNIECILMPVSDPTMSCNLRSSDYFEYPFLDITLPPGERSEIHVVINSGEMPYETNYNFLIIATDIEKGTEHTSVATSGVVTITGSSYEEEKFGEQYHRILWGGGFNYERYLWIILLAAFAGSAVISRDIQENTLALYLSKPITWYDYLISKFSSLILLLSSVTIIPGMILFMTGMAFSSDDIPGILENIPVMGGIILSYMIALVVFASVCMVFSTIIKKWILAGVAIFVSFIFTSTISDILLELFSNDHLKLLNLNLIFKNLFKPLFGLNYNADYVGMEWYVPTLFLLSITAISWAFMIFTFRMKEVAK